MLSMTDPISPSTPPHAATPRLWALIPCAGVGSRALRAGAAASSLPKQYQSVAGVPMVMHTLTAFAQVGRLAHTLVAVSPGDDFWRDPQRGITPGHPMFSTLDCGGASRAETVRNGLLALLAHGAQGQDWVLVHDAARCLITPTQINDLIDACLPDAVGGLLAQPLADTLKSAVSSAQGPRVGSTVDRSEKWLAQTPQMFRIQPLLDALTQAGAAVTDEASAMEAVGLQPRLVPGGSHNFKVTYPDDFALAEAVLAQRSCVATVQLFCGLREQAPALGNPFF